MQTNVKHLLNEVRQCTHCMTTLPNTPKPILQVNPSAKVLIAGQAPGIKAHHSGIPFSDASGGRLREWLGISDDIFYDANQIAILPMAFCYPGKGKSGDLPPVRACAGMWRAKFEACLPNIELTLVIGQYAYAHYFPNSSQTLTEAVKQQSLENAKMGILPHPSPRNNIWLKRNAWFELTVVPALHRRVDQILVS